MDGLPAVPSGDRSVRTESVAFHLELFRLRQLLESIRQGVALANPIVVYRPHVEPAELEDQEHLGRPLADTPHHGQALDDLVVGQTLDPLKWNSPIGHLRGE